MIWNSDTKYSEQKFEWATAQAFATRDHETQYWLNAFENDKYKRENKV